MHPKARIYGTFRVVYPLKTAAISAKLHYRVAYYAWYFTAIAGIMHDSRFNIIVVIFLYQKIFL
jgi:hypothetical protein